MESLELVKLQSEKQLHTVRKQFALAFIKILERDPNFSAWMDLDVYNLVRTYRNHPRGQCTECEIESPLSDGRCAWGCDD